MTRRRPKHTSLRRTEVGDRLDELNAAVDAIEASTGVRADQLLGRCGDPVVCAARGDLMLRLWRAGWGKPAIGVVLQRHQTTVLYGIGKALARERLAADAGRFAHA